MRSNKRSVSAQIKSGIFIACRLIFGFLVFGLAAIGLSLLYSIPLSHHVFKAIAALIVVCLAAAIMFVTAHRWGGFIAGFFFLPGAWRAFGALVSGFGYSYPRHPVTRLESGILVLYCIAVIVLVWRFIDGRRRTVTLTYLDRLALTIFALGIAVLAVRPESYAGPVVGLIALLIAWITFRWRHRKTGKHHTIPTPSELNSR